MNSNDQLGGRRWPKYTVLVFFWIMALVTAIYWALYFRTPVEQNDRTMITVWSVFYMACLLVMIYGWTKSAAMEGVVYCIAILAEAVLPGLCIELASKLDSNAPHILLEVTCHLMLTLMSCGLLFGWGAVLAFEYMKRGGLPWWARAYVLLAIFSAFGTFVWAIKTPATFVNLAAAQQGQYLSAVWPLMYDCPMSRARIYLTVVTLFVPWVRFRFEAENSPGSTVAQ